ncbi:DgyrCDS8085 [Dimorphilus gyrociliatus]|uniref:Carboxylic ester hydrolase n=1 Tax=Dimorphilus gyrociliatus TaxID=2664684 RepID=A0A7I8VUU3_9ANNE|nr:DgyrCDS8085 [Dimorphilus gyrociliatus]
MPAPLVEINENCSIEGGKVFNKDLKKSVECFLGIRYGTAKRFERPDMTELWTGKLNGTVKGKVCPQKFKVFRQNFLPLPLPDTEADASEDCLFINIWRPTKVRKEDNLPVVVFLCCANFKHGSANVYTGETFCAVNRVILVTVSYRLGIFGWASSEDRVLEGNYAFLDQICALKWVQKYIHHFGGDKNNVTLQGSSSGGIMVSAHIVSKKSQGLFHKAICESGNILGQTSKPETLKFNSELFYESAKYHGYKGSRKGEEFKKYLCSIEAEKLCDFLHPNIMLAPVLDGYFIEKCPIEVYKNNEHNKVPLIIGISSDEGYTFVHQYLTKHTDFTVKDEEHYDLLLEKMLRMKAYKYAGEATGFEIIDKVKEFYKTTDKSSDKLLKLVSQIESDVLSMTPIMQQVELHAKSSNVYIYEIHYRPSFLTGPEWVKMPHGNEVAYVFGDPFTKRYPLNWQESDRKISMTLMKTFGDFIINPRPSNWNPYVNMNKMNVKIFQDDSSILRPVFKKDIVRFWSEEIPKILARDEDPYDDETFDIGSFLLIWIMAYGSKLS